MARIEIVLEDTPNGGVSCKATPNFETMMAMDLSGAEWTSAHGLAMFILNEVWKRHKADKNKVGSNVLHLPGLR